MQTLQRVATHVHAPAKPDACRAFVSEPEREGASSNQETPEFSPARRVTEPPQMRHPRDVIRLQGLIGNQAVGRLLRETVSHPAERSAPALQRSVFLGSKTKLDSVAPKTARKGAGDHNVQAMLDHGSNFYFNDQTEMVAYAEKKTDNIGFLKKRNTWIRLPDGLLVLGESHSGTTLSDVVQATGNQRYLYEPHTEIPAELMRRSKRLRTAYTTRRGELAAKAGHQDDGGRINHDLENTMPKVVIGLMGVRTAVANAVKEFEKRSKDKSTTATTNKSGSGAKDEGYSRSASALTYLQRGILVAAKSAKYRIKSQPLWTTNQAMLNTSAKELTRGVALPETSFIRAIATKTFTFEEFIDSFKAASFAELKASGLDEEYAGFETQHGGKQASEDADAPEFEKIREFHMLKKIVAVKGSYRLVGMGDVHRAHLEAALALVDGIIPRSLTKETLAPSAYPSFVAEQKQKYP